MENKNFAFGGITRSIGSAVCADGDLHTAVDVCNDGVGLQLLEKPELLFELRNEKDEDAHLRYTEDLLCVHEPEGAGKHYITQLVVESTATVQQAPAPQNIAETPIGSILNDDTYAPRAGVDIVPYDPPDTAEATVNDIFTIWGEANKIEDNGGTTVTPPGGGGGGGGGGGDEPATISAGIYLCYWEKAEGESEYTCKKMIDITPYGKVTAIQPMGNTLICNHEGGANFPKEIRYWLWKGEDEAYLGLGSKPPMINITFGLNSTFEFYPKTESTFKDNNTKYNKYGGVSIDSYPYTDTVPVFWGGRNSNSWVPPYNTAVTTTNGAPIETHSATYGADDLRIEHFQTSYSLDGVTSPDGKTDVAGMKVNWTTMALGAYNKFIAEQNKDNKFVFPFYVRYAIEMYDGSLIMHSYPVLMIPNSRGPIFALDGKYGLRADIDAVGETYEKVRIQFNGRVYGFSSKLMYDLKALSQDDHDRLENWKDLIRGINIYITPPIYNYKQGGQVLGWRCMSPLDPINNISDAEAQDGATPWNRYYTIGKVNYTDNTDPNSPTEETISGNVGFDDAFKSILRALDPTWKKFFWPYSDPTNNPSLFVPDYLLEIPQKEDSEVTELHENAGQFYKFAEIAYEKLVEITDPEEEAQGEQEVGARKKVLTTIANQDVMQDDNGSHDTMSADVLYGYNRRLNSANVNKIMHSPLQPSVQWARDYGVKVHGGQTSDREYPYQVTVYAKNGAEIARLKSAETGVNTASPQYIFYPNTEAFEALITRGEGSSMKNYMVRLKEHKALNGAFWLADFLNTGYDLTKNNELTNAATANDINLPEANTIVDESNKIYTSETDNPFYVPFGNINIAGGGEVRALAAATQAMSQGQFGQHPMYCFTSEGVWAMTVGDTGGWATIQPVTRDVITAGTKPLSLDSTVVFLGDRGLLQLGGTETTPLSGAVRSYDSAVFSKILPLAQATGMTDLLAAANSLLAFPDVAVLTYDARSGRIYVTPENVEASWVYNLKSGLWTQATTHIDRQVTTYPECEGQQGNMIVEIGGELGYQKDSGLVITRPVKFGDGAVLRRIHEMAVRGQFKPYSGTVKTALWGTRDWINNALVASSQNNRITRWGGSPYFGHSIGLFITQPADYLLHAVGVDAAIDVEHFNKLR